MDGIGGTVKNKSISDVRWGKVQIENAIEGIASLYLPADDLLEDTSDINSFMQSKSMNWLLYDRDLGHEKVKSTPKILSTLKLHRVIREFNVDRVWKLQVFMIATNETPFFEQF